MSTNKLEGAVRSSTADEAAIRGLVDAFIEGWNRADGIACGRPFASDADFTNVMGLRAHGRETIARGHEEILSTVYRGTRVSALVHSIRMVRPDVAVVDADLTMQDEQGTRAQRSNASIVAAREGETWSIVTYHNMIPFQRPTAGPVEQRLAAGGQTH